MKAILWWRQARSLQHVCRATLGAVASLAIAGFLPMPDAYWAPITTLIVLQSDLETTLGMSVRRLVGTAIGAALGALIYTLFGRTILAFGVGIFMSGVACIGLQRATNAISGYVDRTAYRYTAITLAVVLLIPRPVPIWTIALHRFIEVSLGILVAIPFAKLWPEPTDNPTH